MGEQTIAEHIMAAAVRLGRARAALDYQSTMATAYSFGPAAATELADAESALRALVAEACATLPERVCRWREDKDGVWWSDCGQGWFLDSGTPAENNVRFCHGCGLRAEAIAWADEDATHD